MSAPPIHTPDRRASPTLLAILSVALAILAWAAFVRPGATYVSASIHDFVAFLDLMHRMGEAQQPYVDFKTPLGWLAVWLPHVGRLLQGGFAGALECADLLMLCAVLPLAIAALARRVPVGASIFVLLALFGIVATPWRLGYGGWHSDPGVHYNHWGWALLTVLMLFGLPGASSRGRRFVMDAASIGALLSILFFVKLSHFAAGLGFVLLFGAWRGEFRKSACGGLAFLGLCVLCVHAVGGWVDDYIQNVLRVVEVARTAQPQDGNYTPITIARVLHTAHAGLALLAICLAAAAFAGQLTRSIVLHAGFAVVACTAVMTQDTNTPLLMFALTALFVRLAATFPSKSSIRALALLAMALHLLPTLSRQVLASAVFGFVAAGGQPEFAAGHPKLESVWIGGPSRTVNAFTDGLPSWGSPMDGFRWARGNLQHSPDELSHGEYLETLHSGLALLRAQDAGGTPIMTLDGQNPFPALLAAPPPKGVSYDLLVNRQMGRRTAADPSVVFGDARWLMVPKFPLAQDSTRLILKMQAKRLASEWELAAENDHWRLLRAKAPVSPATARP